jgi:hypothetical protein
MNSALKARLKHAAKNTKKGKELAAKTKHLRVKGRKGSKQK